MMYRAARVIREACLWTLVITCGIAGVHARAGAAEAVLLRKSPFRQRLYRPLARPAAPCHAATPVPAPAWLTFVPEMQNVPLLDRPWSDQPWTEALSRQYRDDLQHIDAAWRRLTPEIAPQITPAQVRALSRWALPQMQQYVRVPAIGPIELRPQRLDPAGQHILLEATLDTLPTHSAVVTRWLKVYALYDRSRQSLTQVTVTIRGERLE